MESYKLVLPEHLNHYGYLFGGNMLKWTDEVSWIAASRDFPGCKFVTVAMDRVEFRKSVRQGAILRFSAQRGEMGNSSVRYHVEVFCDDIESGTEDAVFATTVTFVCLDDLGRKSVIAPQT
ncbi:MAG: hotdog domain-containing protein [Gallionellaceae bacterium]|nr:hotdog domain-containing protein [Gallionellaceae bacterium]MDD5365810.1 hotdog domain-containing protein [Gallionellaceae bacterium]